MYIVVAGLRALVPGLRAAVNWLGLLDCLLVDWFEKGIEVSL